MQPPYSRFTLIRDYSVFREYVGIPFERIYVYADKVWNRGKVQQQQQPPPTPQQQQHVSPQHVSQGRSRRKGSRGKMIVHCDSASRSTCVQYRHFYKLGISYEEAFRHFRSYRDRAANRSIVTYRYMCPYLCAALEYVYAHSEGVYGDELLSGVKDASEHVRIPYSFEDVAIVEEGRGWEDESVVFDLIYLPRSADISFQLVDQRPRLQPQSLALATQANLEGGDSW